jgi:hypothetical protein
MSGHAGHQPRPAAPLDEWIELTTRYQIIDTDEQAFVAGVVGLTRSGTSCCVPPRLAPIV